jgi:pilus assembly protein CpaB
MNVKKLALLIGALVIAVITAVMAKNMFAGAGAQQAAAAPAVPLGPKVLVAKKALPVGTIIDLDSFTFQPWPKELMQSAYYVEGGPDSDAKKLLGTVVRYNVTAGQPITRGALVGPQDRGFLAAALGPGMRAITVPVNASASVAGFVFPGDHVDMVLTQQVQGGGDGPALKVSETIVRNIRVLATDQRITDKNDDGKTEVKAFSTVTLEVTPRIAEKVAVAQSMGTLSLSLRGFRRRQGPGERRSNPGAADAARHRQPSGRYQHDLYNWRRRVALSAPHRPRSKRPVRPTVAGHGWPRQGNWPGNCWRRRRRAGSDRTRGSYRPRQQCHRCSGGSSLK